MDAATTLRLARRRAGLTLRALADAAGTSHATLAAYEAGRTVPNVDTLDRILRAAGFASAIAREPRADRTPDERAAKAAELLEVLELAAMFPAEHAAVLRAPCFPASRLAHRVPA